MSDVRWADQSVQQADERKQVEKSEEEKRQSKAAFEKRLQQDRSQKEQVHKQTQAQSQGKAAAQDKATQANRDDAKAKEAQSEKASGKQAKDGAQKAEKKESAVLAHVRQQAKQQGTGVDKNRAGLLQQQQSAAVKRDLERIAAGSQDSGKTLANKGDESASAAKTQEKSRSKEMDHKDRVKDSDVQAARAEAKKDAAQAQNAQALAGAAPAGGPGSGVDRVDADGRRQGGQQGGQPRQGPPVDETQQARGPSAQSVERAAKAEMIQKLCEKLLDNYYLGAAPDGSAMMRMELKEGVLAGLIVDVKVDDKRRVKLELSGGNKEAVDMVTASRGELARALGRKGLVLETVEAR